MSEDSQSRAVTYYATVKPFWRRRRPGHFVSSLELLVLSGDVRVGDYAIGSGGYAYLPAFWPHEEMSSRNGATCLMMFNGSAAFQECPSGSGEPVESEPIILDTRALDWKPPPAFEGRSKSQTTPDSFVKWLRVDQETQAYTLLSKHGPSWADQRIEAHNIWEELFLLEGDCLLGPTGALGPGAYIFRPEKIPHGPLASQTGVVWFGRGNAMIDFQYSQASWAEDLVGQYLKSDTYPREPLSPWGTW